MSKAMSPPPRKHKKPYFPFLIRLGTGPQQGLDHENREVLVPGALQVIGKLRRKAE